MEDVSAHPTRDDCLLKQVYGFAPEVCGAFRTQSDRSGNTPRDGARAPHDSSCSPKAYGGHGLYWIDSAGFGSGYGVFEAQARHRTAETRGLGFRTRTTSACSEWHIPLIRFVEISSANGHANIGILVGTQHCVDRQSQTLQ